MVKCSKCGVENPDGTVKCSVCGDGLAKGNRQCVSCGRSIDWVASVCPYCGHDFRIAPGTPLEKTIDDSTKLVLYLVSVLIPVVGIIVGIYYLTRSSQAEKSVGKICLAIGVVIVLLTIGMAALLYVMVLGFETGTRQTPTAALAQTPVTGGVQIAFIAVSAEVAWSDVTIVLSDGTDFAEWHPQSQDLSGALDVSKDYGAQALSALSVTLTVTDKAGNGYVEGGDYFILASSPSFSAYADYLIDVVYEPTGASLASTHFSG